MALGKSNYANATLLMLVYFSHWKSENFSFVSIFKNNFKAFSEEKGEASIHLLQKQINDFKIDLDSLNCKFQNVSAFTQCMNIFNFDLSHKNSKVKSFPMLPLANQIPPTPFDMISVNFLEIIKKIEDNTYRCFIHDTKALKLTSQLDSVDTDVYNSLIRNFDRAPANAQKRLFSLKISLKKKYKKPAQLPWEFEVANWHC